MVLNPDQKCTRNLGSAYTKNMYKMEAGWGHLIVFLCMHGRLATTCTVYTYMYVHV